MAENQRESFRVEEHLDAELFHQGRTVPCAVLNLSAGGARVQSGLEMQPGSQCTLGVVLPPELRDSAGVPYVSFLMEVLEQTPIRGGELEYRLRNVSGAGSATWEAANRVVFAAQRRARARETGHDDSSSMVSDPERRRRFRVPAFARFGKRSMRGFDIDD